MENSQWFKSPEMLVGLSAVLVSVVALAVGIYSAHIDRISARASVWPSLMLAQSYSADRFQFLVLNQGTGPAVIKYARVQQNGSFQKDWRSVLQRLGNNSANFAQAHIGGGVVRPAQTIVAFETTDRDLQQRLLKGSKISFEICYCSVFDQCWIADFTDPTTEVASCATDQGTRFLQ
jgi:apolipoprotein N-acyltransferase